MPTATVYVVSADPAMRACLVELLRSASLRSEAFTDLQACLDHVGSDQIGCLLIDLPANAPGGSEPSRAEPSRASSPPPAPEFRRWSSSIAATSRGQSAP